MSFEWKRPAIFGVTFAITVFVLGCGCLWWLDRPRGMDDGAIKVVSSRATQTFEVNDLKKEIKPNGLELYFVLANTTGRDYTLPQDAKLFRRNAQTGALSELNGKLDHAFLIPAKDRVEVGIEIPYSCDVYEVETGITTQRDAETCYKDAVGGDSGFLVLDYTNHIKIELPKPALTPTPPKPPVAGKS